MNTFRDVLAIHRWDTPGVVPVEAGSSLEDPICVFSVLGLLNFSVLGYIIAIVILYVVHVSLLKYVLVRQYCNAYTYMVQGPARVTLSRGDGLR